MTSTKTGPFALATRASHSAGPTGSSGPAFVAAGAAVWPGPVAATASQAKAMETIAALAAARESIVACHAELQKDHRRLGYGAYAVGPIGKPDDWLDPKETRRISHLRNVA